MPADAVNSQPQADAAPRRVQFTVRTMIIVVVVIAVVLAIVRALGLAIAGAQESARQTQCRGNMSYIAMALHNYHGFYGSFPPAYVADNQGRPMHSWRTLILPWIERNDLFAAYNFAEPWDGPNNILLGKTPLEPFVCPTAGPATGAETNYVLITGPGTAFPGDRCTNLQDMRDGQANTILLAEFAGANIVWTEPRDLNVETMSFAINDSARPSISSRHPLGPAIVPADGISAWRATDGVSPATLRGLVTIAGGEKVEVLVLIERRLLVR